MADPLTITEASALLRTGSLTAVELLDQVAARIAATEPELHAYASLDLDRARADAGRADGSARRGPLHGIPFGVKDVFTAAGTRTSCGSPTLADHAPDRDADVVAAVRAAGAVLVGKHVTHELTCGVDTPPTRNPLDGTRYPGGSSVGSGVSVAVGSALFAIGTDSSGSVRNPASVNGIVGLKPTYGLLSTTGVVRAATAPTLDHVGILARTVADVALVLEALVPGTTPVAPAEPTGLRLGVLELGEQQIMDPEVEAIVRSVLADLVELGADLVPVRLPELHDAASVAATVFAVEIAEGNRAVPAGHHPGVSRLLRAGAAVPDTAYRAALSRRDRLRDALLTAMADQRLDALVSPTMPQPPPLLAELVPEKFLPTAVAWMCPFNLSGQPAISVPAGMTASGLPAGVQIATGPGEDGTALRIAELVTWVRQ